MRQTAARCLAPAVLLAFLLLLWEGLSRLLAVPAFILPPPSAIAAAVWELRGPLFGVHLPVTLGEIALGLALALAVGVGLAVAMHFSPLLERAIYPLVVASQTVPIIAISPVFLLWFGYSIWQKVAVIVLISFFSITVNTFDGLRARDPELVELLQAAGAGRWQVFLKAEVPAALPLFFSGLKIAAAMCVIGATIGEWLGASAGLGYFGRRMASTMRAAPLFASVFILSLVGIALFGLIAWLEQRLLPWHHRRQA